VKIQDHLTAFQN